MADIADLMQHKIDAGCMSHEVAELIPARVNCVPPTYSAAKKRVSHVAEDVENKMLWLHICRTALKDAVAALARC